MKTLAERFWEKVDTTGDCWLWMGARSGHADRQGYAQGYGQLNVSGRDKKATHIAWFLETGTWPVNQMCHTCDNPPCVRIAHLFDGTQKDNMQDALKKGRTVATMRGRKHSQETRKRMSKSHLGLKHSQATRKLMSKSMLASKNRRFSSVDIQAIQSATCFQRITAAHYGVSQGTISAIKRCQLYR